LSGHCQRDDDDNEQHKEEEDEEHGDHGLLLPGGRTLPHLYLPRCAPLGERQREVFVCEQCS
jgi:hypothetical protein